MTDELLPLPSSVSVERALLGSILRDPEQFERVAAGLDAADFSLEKHRTVYDYMGRLSAAGDGIDEITLAEALLADGHLESVQGISGLLEIKDAAPELPNLESYVRILRDKSQLRQTIRACADLSAQCFRAGEDPSVVLQRADAVLGDLARKSGTQDGEPRRLLKIIEDFGVESFWYPHTTARNLVPWPYGGMRRFSRGMSAGQLIVLAARPGIGKSLCLGEIMFGAAEQSYGGLLISLEMSAAELIRRIICARSDVPWLDWQRGNITSGERERMYAVSGTIDTWPIWVDDCPAHNVVAAIRRAVKERRREYPISVVGIDYLQLMDVIGRSESRNQALSSITRGLKLLAKELGIVIVLLSQLSRDSVKAGERPQLHHLRDSGAIEQDADTVLFLHPVENPDTWESPLLPTDLIIGKQRNGPRGRLSLVMNRPLNRFEETQDTSNV